MKPILRFPVLIFLTFAILFVACRKEKTVTSVIEPLPISDGLTGTEVIFNNVIFESADFFGLGINDVYAGSPARPDLFSKSRPLDVSIKFNNSSNWIKVPFWSSLTHAYTPVTSLPNFNGYTFEFYNSILFVFAFPLNYQLVDTRISIKVKFL